jgi:hypothetical protein
MRRFVCGAVFPKKAQQVQNRGAKENVLNLTRIDLGFTQTVLFMQHCHHHVCHRSKLSSLCLEGSENLSWLWHRGGERRIMTF